MNRETLKTAVCNNRNVKGGRKKIRYSLCFDICVKLVLGILAFILEAAVKNAISRISLIVF